MEYTLESFVESGVDEIVIVIGYRGEMVQQWIGDGRRFGAHIEYAVNPNYEAGNGLSVYAARDFVGDSPFVLSMADHMVGSDLLGTLLSSTVPCPSLCVDFSADAPPQLHDATRVLVSDEGKILEIGKDLESWNGVDSGVFMLDGRVFRALEKVGLGEKCQLSHAISWIARNGNGIHACDISGQFWMDVDTPADLSYVEDLLNRETAPLV
jgi:choline kinase